MPFFQYDDRGAEPSGTSGSQFRANDPSHDFLLSDIVGPRLQFSAASTLSLGKRNEFMSMIFNRSRVNEELVVHSGLLREDAHAVLGAIHSGDVPDVAEIIALHPT
jgi:hypothetical protein